MTEQFKEMTIFDFIDDAEDSKSREFLLKEIPSLINEICKKYEITKNAFFKMMDWEEDFLNNGENLAVNVMAKLSVYLDEPESFEKLLNERDNVLTPSSRKKVLIQLQKAKIENMKEDTGKAFIKILGAHELGYRSGIPRKAGSFLLIPKEATKKVFGELNPLKPNDDRQYKIKVPEGENVNFTYVYHNSKFSSNDPKETRDEYRLYSSYLSGLTPDDIVLFTHSAGNSDFRMYLFSPLDEEYPILEKLIQDNKIGRSSSAIISLVDLFSNRVIVSEMFHENTLDDVFEEETRNSEVNEEGKQPVIAVSAIGDLLDEEIQTDDINTVIQLIKKIKRDNRFRKIILNAYTGEDGIKRCSVSGISLSYGELTNLQAAHIIPKELGGTDNPTNGIPLSSDLHWAFDRGFFTILNDYTVKVHDEVKDNDIMRVIDRKKILLPSDNKFYPSLEALEFHRKNIFGKFLTSK